MKHQSPTINPNFVPDATDHKPVAPTTKFLETNFQTSIESLLTHGYRFEQIRKMTGDDFCLIYETLRLRAITPPGLSKVTVIANPFAKN